MLSKLYYRRILSAADLIIIYFLLLFQPATGDWSALSLSLSPILTEILLQMMTIQENMITCLRSVLKWLHCFFKIITCVYSNCIICYSYLTLAYFFCSRGIVLQLLGLLRLCKCDHPNHQYFLKSQCIQILRRICICRWNSIEECYHPNVRRNITCINHILICTFYVLYTIMRFCCSLFSVSLRKVTFIGTYAFYCKHSNVSAFYQY